MKRFAAGLLLGILIGPPVWALALMALGGVIYDPDDQQVRYFSRERGRG